MTRRVVLLGGAAVLAVGILCQVVQTTDPKPAAAYFTVWSAVLAAVVLAGAGLGSRVPVDLWVAAVTGTVLSGLTFAAVIAPATETGTWFQPHDDGWVRTANVLLHGVGPAWAVVAFLSFGPLVPPPLGRRVVRWLVLPAGYLGVVLGLQGLGVGRVPYPFLDPAETAWPLVVLSALGLAVVFAALAVGLARAGGAARRRRELKPTTS